MGVDTRKPLLPAPTDSSTLDTGGESAVGTDIATDLSRVTEKTSYSIPEDGSPITIQTGAEGDSRKGSRPGLHGRHKSQTSLLIEYFEAGKGSSTESRRPSVRVKVTPSSRKNRTGSDHIQITESSGNRRPSHVRRISLGKPTGAVIGGEDERSISSYASAAEDSTLTPRPPIDIEVMHKGDGSDLTGSSVSQEARYMQPTSDISSMPPDSMLGASVPLAAAAATAGAAAESRRQRSRSVSREDIVKEKDRLKTPSRRRSRSLSRERITQKVIEKLNGRPAELSSSKRRHSRGSKTSSRSASKEVLKEDLKSPKRRSGRHRREEEPSIAESSLLTNSNLAPSARSVDQYSFRSGTSKSSMNNPKLLETVEDAIKRLILPELTALKNEQKTTKNRPKFEEISRESYASASSMPSEDVNRNTLRQSAASYDTYETDPQLAATREEEEEDLESNVDSRRRRSHRKESIGSPSERSYDRRTSEDTITEEKRAHKKKSKDGHRVRDAAAGALAGGILTAAALKHHDSKSSIDSQKRRKRRSKSRSRSASIAEQGEDIFHKHDVPPMPMRSEIESDLTRTSLLSEQTTSTESPVNQRAEFKEVLRGSPRQAMSPISPASRTPTRTPLTLQKRIAMRHSNQSQEETASIHSMRSEHSLRSEGRNSPNPLKHGLEGAALGAGAVAAGNLLGRHEQTDEYRHSPRQEHTLSPIQSVASLRDDENEVTHRRSIQNVHSSGSTSSAEHLRRRKDQKLSIDSLSSAPSTKFARSRRPEGVNLEKPSTIIGQHDLADSQLSPHEPEWYGERDLDDAAMRQAMGTESLLSEDHDVESKRMTNYTDDSLDVPGIEKITAGQHVRGIVANPEYVDTPDAAVESAVASLCEPSTVDLASTKGISALNEQRYSYATSEGRPRSAGSARSYRGSERSMEVSHQGSPLKQRHDAYDETSFPRRMGTSPPQSIARSASIEDEEVELGASGLPIADDPMPEIGHGLDSESDLNTNPSIIQGPIGGVVHGSRDHWPYSPTPPKTVDHKLKEAEAGLLGAAAGVGIGSAIAHHQKKSRQDLDERYDDGDSMDLPRNQPYVEDEYGNRENAYMSGQHTPTRPASKDEGYISAPAPGISTPEPNYGGGAGFDMADLTGIEGAEDPFYNTEHRRILSGYSQGLDSPLYDSATGKGLDRIESKDIAALMQHVSFPFLPR